MRFGIDVPNLGLDGEPETLAELAALAERAGWDGFFVWDSLEIESTAPAVRPTCDPWISLAAAAMRTERIRLGPMVLPPARRRPWKLARETASLDRLSRGRLILPVALGSTHDGGFAKVGEPLDRRARAERLDEALAILDGLWSGEPFAHAGEHYTVAETVFEPRPVQQPRIPIWVVAAWPRPRSMRRAHRWDGALPFKMDATGSQAAEGHALAGGLTPADTRAIVAEGRAARDGAPWDVVLAGALDPEHGAEQVSPYVEAGATWWIEAGAWQAMWRAPGDLGPIRACIERGPPRL